MRFGSGLVKGTTSLIGHTVGGVMGSASKITGFVQRGLMALTVDEDFQNSINNQTMEVNAGASLGQSALYAGKGVVKVNLFNFFLKSSFGIHFLFW